MGVAGQIIEGDGDIVNELPLAAKDERSGWLHFPKNYGKPCMTNWMASGNVGVRREVFLTLGGMDETFGEALFARNPTSRCVSGVPDINSGSSPQRRSTTWGTPRLPKGARGIGFTTNTLRAGTIV